MYRHETCAVRIAICVHVLHRFVAAVLVERAVVVMMMRLVLQMHRGVRSAFAMAVSST